MTAVQADIAQAVAAGNGDTAPGGAVEWRVRDANGVERWIEAVCTNLLADPVVAGIVLNGRDVSERKQLEVELPIAPITTHSPDSSMRHAFAQRSRTLSPCVVRRASR